jgi:hypothetical protein
MHAIINHAGIAAEGLQIPGIAMCNATGSMRTHTHTHARTHTHTHTHTHTLSLSLSLKHTLIYTDDLLDVIRNFQS